MRTIRFDGEQGSVLLIDQTRLPHETSMVVCQSAEDVAEAIRSMRIRGAPAIGVAAAYGLALAARSYTGVSPEGLLAHLEQAAALLGATRPTAVNLRWALERGLRAARDVVATQGVAGTQV